MKSVSDKSLVVAKAQDTYDFLNHIGWTDTIKPALDNQIKSWSQMLIAEALGNPLPEGKTREQIAGMCYGITFVSALFEKIIKEGKTALNDLTALGIRLQ